ncbi:cytochrome oxidase assembly protein ShyY1 [Antricoccus suffuscus]|uniref:SURF1-like protein n=1 Tax=Antricoccus suffuscus TaxID=1629062 RepID=A0A2T1A230_9ACTN|nr:SURF1 family protein [Antricoccus suffuscus]PRZ42388.1 cytochrome oxidase assembly protein ShyY1 [Antricoccus suffuscus]
MYRFLLTPKWLASIAGVVIAILVMIGLANWQLDRLYTKRAANAAITASAKAAVVPADTLLPASAKEAPKGSAEWHRVSVTGTYLVDKTVLIRGSTTDQGVGFEVVVPLKAADGSVYLIDRGFVLAPSSADQLPTIPDAPKGQVDVTGRARLTHASIGSATEIDLIQGTRTVRALNTESLAHALKLKLSGGYVTALEEVPADGASYPKIERIALPNLDEGPHLSYAVQWFLFAGLSFVAFLYLIKREGDLRLLGDDDWDDEPFDDDEPDRAGTSGGPTGDDPPPDPSKYSTKVLH